MNEQFIPGSIKPESDYLELERLGTKLGVPVPTLRLSVTATNPDGSLGDHYEGRARTWNRNYWNIVFAQLGALSSNGNGSNAVIQISNDPVFGAGHINVKDTTGTIGTNSNWQELINVIPSTFNTGVGISNSGIVIGTGVTAESFEAIALSAPIIQGTGAGQMSYTAGSFTQPTYNAGTKVWTSAQTRIFNNNSSGTIVVAETALITQCSNVPTVVMLERSLLGVTVSVLAAGQLTVTYTTTLTFPA